MPDYPTCAGCDRAAPDRIEVRGVLWEPDLDRHRGEWRCWACRLEPHPDMPAGYVPEPFFEQVREHLSSEP